MIKVDVNEITVTVKGREVTLSEKELVSILEQHFKILNVVKGVEVNPITIDESIFEIGEKEHYYSHEEYIMQLIQKAFIEMKKDIRRYARPFEIVTPAELEPVYTEEKMVALAEQYGDHLADWVEQALQWAQKIANGEDIFNKSDDSKWFRAISWQDGHVCLVGGSEEFNNHDCASAIHEFHVNSFYQLHNAVPAIVRYK